MSARQVNWSRLAIFSLISTILIAIVLYIVLDDARWVAGVVLGLGLLEAGFLVLVMPRLAGAEEEAPIRDGDWGVAPPSEPELPSREPELPPAPESDPLDD
jgi:hypothetical protein